MRELLKDEKKTFTFVEMKFFSMWFYMKNENAKIKVRKLVETG
jgi:hypothetical protein